jgi:hypothetical protein
VQVETIHGCFSDDERTILIKPTFSDLRAQYFIPCTATRVSVKIMFLLFMAEMNLIKLFICAYSTGGAPTF